MPLFSEEDLPWLLEQLKKVMKDHEENDLLETAEYIHASFDDQKDLIEWVSAFMPDEKDLDVFASNIEKRFGKVEEVKGVTAAPVTVDALQTAEVLVKKVELEAVDTTRTQPPVVADVAQFSPPHRKKSAKKDKDRKGKPLGFSSLFHSKDHLKSRGHLINKSGQRLLCLCQGREHRLVGNCVFCGKIVCEFEGPGPCLYCGHDVPSLAAPWSDLPLLEADEFQRGFDRAVHMKDQLMKFYVESASRTKVYDDHTDFFTEGTANQWLSSEERKEALKKQEEEQERREKDKKTIFLDIDFKNKQASLLDKSAEQAAGYRTAFHDWQNNLNQSSLPSSKFQPLEEQRKILSPPGDDSPREQNWAKGRVRQGKKGGKSEVVEQLRKAILEQATANLKAGRKCQPDKAEKKEDHRFHGRAEFEGEFDQEVLKLGGEETKETKNGEGERLIYSPSSYVSAFPLEHGKVLTMHQPWASLVIAGWKRLEGRNWFQDFSGTLWIHAAAKEVDFEETQRIIAFYQHMYTSAGLPTPPIPTSFPRSALLGCVDCEKVIKNEDRKFLMARSPSDAQQRAFREEWVVLDEENSAEFLFVCSRPRRLAVPVEMGGEHKLWDLPRGMPERLRPALKNVKWPKPNLLAQGKGEDQVERLDLWAGEKEGAIGEKAEKDMAIEVISEGFYVIKNFVSLATQQSLVNICRGAGLADGGWFTEEFFGKGGDIKGKSHCSRFSWGWHWNAHTNRYEEGRGNIDGKPCLPIPGPVAGLYGKAVEACNTLLGNNKKLVFSFSSADMAIVNFYRPCSGRLGLHQDSSESAESIRRGDPIVGLCIGDDCQFSYSLSHKKPEGGEGVKAVRVSSGDCVIFGGRSRLLWHGISDVRPNSGPRGLRMIPGRLSITLRRY